MFITVKCLLYYSSIRLALRGASHPGGPDIQQTQKTR